MCSVVQEWFRALWNYCLCLVLPLSVYCSSKWHTSRNRQVFAIPLKYISLTRHHHFSQVLDLLPDSLVHFSRQLLLPKTYSAFSSSSLYIVHVDVLIMLYCNPLKKNTLHNSSHYKVAVCLSNQNICVCILFLSPKTIVKTMIAFNRIILLLLI